MSFSRGSQGFSRRGQRPAWRFARPGTTTCVTVTESRKPGRKPRRASARCFGMLGVSELSGGFRGFPLDIQVLDHPLPIRSISGGRFHQISGRSKNRERTSAKVAWRRRATPRSSTSFQVSNGRGAENRDGVMEDVK